jgi:hypothetical protein
MGEQSAVGDSIVRNQANGIYSGLDNHLQNIGNIGCLRNIYGDKLKYVHNAAFGYGNCEFNLILEAVLVVKHKSFDGEISYAS